MSIGIIRENKNSVYPNLYLRRLNAIYYFINYLDLTSCSKYGYIEFSDFKPEYIYQYFVFILLETIGYLTK